MASLSCSSPPAFALFNFNNTALFNLTVFGQLVGFESGSEWVFGFSNTKQVGSIYVSFYKQKHLQIMLSNHLWLWICTSKMICKA
jgi:hypothetical protein